MLKICHITSAHPRYDIRIFVKECLTLAKNGNDVSLIVADENPDEEKNGVKIYSVGKPTSRVKRMRETPKLIFDKILQISPDFVHFHDPELMLMCLNLRKHKIKVVYDVHEDLPKQIMNKHWIPKFIRSSVSKLALNLEKYCSSRFYGVIAATPIIAKRFIYYNPNTVTVCNYPILAELNIIESKWEDRENCLCYIGSISITRGIKPVVESLPLSHLKLKLAGPFSGDINLEQINKMDGGKSVDYLGVLNREGIVELLKKVKIGMVTLLPTPSYIESLPIKMFEYMIAGIPVVASDFPLWAEIIVKHNCGILVDPSDKSAIAKSCNYIIQNPSEAIKMGANGKNAVLNYFNWENESKNLIKFYMS